MTEQSGSLAPKETNETEVPASSIELDTVELPGRSAEDAILLTNEQARALQEARLIAKAKTIDPRSRFGREKELAEREVEIDPALIEAAKTWLEAEYARFPNYPYPDRSVCLWVRTEEPQQDPYGDVDYNTWEVWIGEHRYGEVTAARYFTHPDGRIEEVYRIRPIRGSF